MHASYIYWKNVNTSAVLAGKACDKKELWEWLASREIKAVIEPKRSGKCDYWYYKDRYDIDCMFGKLKHYRRIATRYEKKAINDRGCYHFPQRFYG